MSKKKVSRTGLLKGNQRTLPLDGKGSRGTGAPKLRPSNDTEQTWSRESLKKGNQKSTPGDGNQGPKRT